MLVSIRSCVCVMVLALFSAAWPGLTSLAMGAEIEPANITHEGAVDFQQELLPVLRKKCLACHNGTDAESGLVLETPAAMLKGGNEGPAVVAGKPDESLAYLLAAQRQEPVMPPEANSAGAEPFTPEELALFRLWIEQGAQGDVQQAAEAIAWKQLPQSMTPVLAAALSAEGRFLAAARGNQAWVYDRHLGAYVDQLIDPALSDLPMAHGGGIADLDLIQSLAFSPDGDWIASGGYRTVRLWRRQPDFVAMQKGLGKLRQAEFVGAAMAIVTDTHSIQVIDAESGAVRWEVAAVEGQPTVVALGPAADRLAVVREPMSVVVHRQDGSQVVVSSPAPVRALCWADAETLAIGGEDGKIYLKNLPADGSDVDPRVLAGPSRPVVALHADHAGRLFTADDSGEVQQWNLADGQLQRTFAHGAPVTELAVTTDGTRLVTAGADSPAKLWNLADGALVAELKQNAQLTWQADNTALAQQVAKRHVDNAQADLEAAKKRTTDEEASLGKTKEASDKAQQELTAAQEAATKALTEQQTAEAAVTAAKANLAAAEATLAQAAADDAKQAAQQVLEQAKQALATAENELKPKQEALDAANKAQMEKSQASESAKRSVETSEKALSDARQEVAQLEPQVVARTEELKVAEATAAAAAQQVVEFRSVGQFVAAGSAFVVTGDRLGNVLVWKAGDGTLVDQRHAADDNCVAVSLAGDAVLRVVTAEHGVLQGTLQRHWKLQRVIGSPDEQSSIEDRVTAVAFDPSGRTVAVGGGQPSRSGELEIYDVATGQLLREFKDAHSDVVFGLAFSPDGKRLASCGADRFMKVFDVETATLMRTYEGHTHHVLAVGWRADGRVLATGGADKVVKLWNVADGSQIRTIQGFGKEVTSLQFAGASDQLFAACGDQNLYRCDMGGDRRSVGSGADFLYVVSVDRLGKAVAFGGHDSVVRAVDPEGKVMLELAPSPSP